MFKILYQNQIYGGFYQILVGTDDDEFVCVFNATESKRIFNMITLDEYNLKLHQKLIDFMIKNGFSL
jgi:hypothetical protein